MCAHTHIYVCVCTQLYVCACVCQSVHLSTSLTLSFYICVFVIVCVCACVCACVYICSKYTYICCTHICISKRTRIRTHLYTYKCNVDVIGRPGPRRCAPAAAPPASCGAGPAEVQRGGAAARERPPLDRPFRLDQLLTNTAFSIHALYCM